jgi:regulator of ribonuclease activity A
MTAAAAARLDFETAELFDQSPDTVAVCELQFRSFGLHRCFFGECVPFEVFEDHRPLRALLSEPGQGRVAVVDTLGSLRVGMLGDTMSRLAIDNGWAGVIVNGAIRDGTAIDRLEFGVKALGTTARRNNGPITPSRRGAVTFGGVRFEPGHWVYADADCVVSSPTRISLSAG